MRLTLDFAVDISFSLNKNPLGLRQVLMRQNQPVYSGALPRSGVMHIRNFSAKLSFLQ